MGAVRFLCAIVLGVLALACWAILAAPLAVTLGLSYLALSALGKCDAIWYRAADAVNDAIERRVEVRLDEEAEGDQCRPLFVDSDNSNDYADPMTERH